VKELIALHQPKMKVPNKPSLLCGEGA